MAIKLFDLIESWFGEVINKNVKDNTTDKIANAAQELDNIAAIVDQLNDNYERQKRILNDTAKTHGVLSQQYEDENNKLKDIKKDLEKQNKKEQDTLKDLARQTNLSVEELNEYITSIKTHGVEATKAARSTEQFRNIMSGVSKSLGFDLKALSAEFFSFAAIIAMATEQLVKSNQELVENARRTGGAITNRTLGFDAYGNNQINTGSLTALTNINNISEEHFFQALSGFAKGRVIGQDYSKSAGDLQRFAVEQGKLIKLYGVAAGDVQRITEVSTQLYGVSIKQLNTEFENGAKTAKMAGLNVQEYFKNLAQASELIGETYIQGGTQGLEKLAMLATKLNTSVNNLVHVGDQFKNISDIFTQQAKGVNLGLNNYAQQAGLLFAKSQLGLYEEANKIAITALSKDVQKYTDKNGVIDQRGIRALTEMGFDKEYIQLIQRTIQAQRKLGVSFEELTDISELSTKKQIEYYAEMNRSATITEKLNRLWGTFKSVILDPIASVLGPALDITINLLIIAFQTLYVALKPLIYVVQIIGKGLTLIANKLAGITGYIEEKFKKIGIYGDKVGATFDKVAEIAGSVVAGFLVLRGATYAAAAAQGMGSKLSGFMSLIGGLLPGRGPAMARLAGMRLGGLARGAATFAPKLIRGAGIAAVGGIAGDAISSLGPEGGVVNRLGGAVSGAATGAAIGSIIPGIGTAIGAVVGGILGLFKFDEIKNGIFKIVDWVKKLFGPIAYLIPIFNTFVVIKDIWTKYFGDKKKDEEQKIGSEYKNTEDVYQTLNNTLNQRTIETFKAEKAQEKILNNINAPIIHVDAGLFPGAKMRMSGS